MSNLPTIGFIGTGMIGSAMIQGFCERVRENFPIVISNRSLEKAQALKDKYPDKIELCESFQDCVDKADIVVVAVLPAAGAEVYSSIKFKESHRIVSMISTMAEDEVRPHLNCNVAAIVHMIPGTFVSVVEGPIITCPSDAVIEDVFGKLGKIVPLPDRESEKKLMSLTGMFAPIFSVEDTLIRWCLDQGLPKESAFSYTTALFKALAEEACMTDVDGVHTLATVNTPGGINMQAVDQITEAGGFKSFADALDGILKRLMA